MDYKALTIRFTRHYSQKNAFSTRRGKRREYSVSEFSVIRVLRMLSGKQWPGFLCEKHFFVTNIPSGAAK